MKPTYLNVYRINNQDVIDVIHIKDINHYYYEIMKYRDCYIYSFLSFLVLTDKEPEIIMDFYLDQPIDTISVYSSEQGDIFFNDEINPQDINESININELISQLSNSPCFKINKF